MTRIPGFCAEIKQVTCDDECILRQLTTRAWKGAAQPGVTPYDMARAVSSALEHTAAHARSLQAGGDMPQADLQAEVAGSVVDDLATELAVGEPAAVRIEEALGACVARRLAGDCPMPTQA